MIFTPHLKLGFHYDTNTKSTDTEGFLFAGESKLLEFLEKQVGLYAPVRRDDHLRIEYYRLLLEFYLRNNPDCFYALSFQAEPLAVAEHLLGKRDELILAGLDFKFPNDNLPKRLRTLAQIETYNKVNSKILNFFHETLGFADRFVNVLKGYEESSFKFKSIHLVESRSDFPCHLQRFLDLSEKKGIVITQQEQVIKKREVSTHLETFQSFLLGNRIKNQPTNEKDKSIIILESPNESDAATLLSHFLKNSSTFRPFFLVKDSHRVLDEALLLNGFPTMGLASSSEVRPSLQILKLATAFLWKPIDAPKILQFVALRQKPFNTELGYVIARLLSEKPGIGSSVWNEQIAIFFDHFPEGENEKDRIKSIGAARQFYDFWFQRARYDINTEVPIEDVKEIFTFLTDWASDQLAKSFGKSTSMRVLSEQARRVEEYFSALLDTGERKINKQNIERVIRVIVEPTPFQPTINAVDSTLFAYHESLIPNPVKQLVWWNFTDSEIPSEPLFWETSEIEALNAINCPLDTPKKNQSRQLFYQKLPFLNTSEQIILVIPRLITGVEVKEHPLLSYLKVCFKDISRLYWHHQNFQFPDINSSTVTSRLFTEVKLPMYHQVQPYILDRTQPHLNLGFNVYADRTHENISTIENLLYYPHTWFLGAVLNLHRTNLVSSISENVLRGRTAHRFFELILNADFKTWKKTDVEFWFKQNAMQILEHEGVLLLQYGEETNLQYFLEKVKKSVWALINYIRDNNWNVLGTEKKLETALNSLKLKGISDLVLQRADEICIIDMKWSGYLNKETLLKNFEDFQLILYGLSYYQDTLTKIHGAYYIIDAAKLLVRNAEAFNDVPLSGNATESMEAYQNILNKIDATFRWRQAQFENGLVEIRTEHTIDDLELYYETYPEGVVEMRREAFKFDDFRWLINNVI